MPRTFEVGLSLGELSADFFAMSKNSNVVLSRALNRAGVSGKTAMVRDMAKDTGITAKVINREIVLNKATRSQPVVSLTIQGRRLPLIAFKATGPEPSRGRGRGVGYKLPGGRSRIPNAFIATMRSGHRGVYRVGDSPRRGRRARPRQGELPIFELFGPSLPHVFERFIPTSFAPAAQASFEKNLASELNYENLKSAQGGD